MGSGRRWRGSWGLTNQVPPQLNQFAEVARRYCEWADSEARDAIDLLMARRLLAELQLAATSLPEVGSGDHQKIHKPPPELKQKVLDRVSAVPFRRYWAMFNPLKENEEPVCGDLADDLADIWLDLWEGLYLFDHGHMLESNFHWRVLYDSHWGQHVLEAERAIYAFLTK
jgi:hypothetical protein